MVSFKRESWRRYHHLSSQCILDGAAVFCMLTSVSLALLRLTWQVLLGYTPVTKDGQQKRTSASRARVATFKKRECSDYYLYYFYLDFSPPFSGYLLCSCGVVMRFKGVNQGHERLLFVCVCICSGLAKACILGSYLWTWPTSALILNIWTEYLLLLLLIKLFIIQTLLYHYHVCIVRFRTVQAIF